MKKCTRCGEFKLLSLFSFLIKRKKKYRSQCKQCNSLVNKEYRATHDFEIKNYRSSRKQSAKITRRNYYNNHKMTELANNKNYVATNREELRNKRNQRQRIKRSTDRSFVLRKNISSSINRMLRQNGFSKSKNSCLEYLPFSIQELKISIENKFECWMTWENQGHFKKNTWIDNDSSTWKWQLDHIIPHSTFEYSSMDCDEFRKCWSLNNLRPLSAKQNWLDGVNRTRHKQSCL